MTDRRPRPDARHRGRAAALQMLYQWEVGRGGVDEVLDTFWTVAAGVPSARARDFASSLVRGTVAHLDAIDPLIAASAEHWRLSRMAVIDRLILRLGVYELLHTPSVPPRVVINEALELARSFSTDEAVKFINGVLDAIKRRLEAGEPVKD